MAFFEVMFENTQHSYNNKSMVIIVGKDRSLFSTTTKRVGTK